MSKLRFSDGAEFDTSGELRITKRSDRYYVLGNGIMSAVDSLEKGKALIAKLKKYKGEE